MRGLNDGITAESFFRWKRSTEALKRSENALKKPPPLSFSLYLSKALWYESEGHVEGTKTNGLPCSAPSLWFSASLFRSSNTKWSWHCAHVCTKKWGWLNKSSTAPFTSPFTHKLYFFCTMWWRLAHLLQCLLNLLNRKTLKTVFWICVQHGYCALICFSLIMSKCRMSLFRLHSFSSRFSLYGISLLRTALF